MPQLHRQAARRCPQLRDVASDQQNGGLQATLVIDRDTASRLGITPQMIDDTLYDAFGQRQISIMFTQLNQYRVVLEVKPEFQQNPGRAEEHLHPFARRAAKCRSSAFTHFENRDGAAGGEPPGTVPGGDAVVQPGAGRIAGRRGRRRSTRPRTSSDMPASMQASFQGTAAAFQASLANEPMLILAALVTVYIVLGVLYESYIHPITILSTLPSAGVGALLALMICHTDFSVIALIGIILLIGIVKKNAIMMIDFALEAERKEGKPPREAIYQACLLRFRPIMMTTLAALLRRRAAGAGHRHRLGAAPAAGHHDRRRPDLQPGADALHHAGDLSGVRPAGQAVRAARESALPDACRRNGRGARMSLSTPFIRPAGGTTLLTVAITLAGAIALSFLPVAPLPQVDFPTIQVTAALPGASPETMASSVATPLERQFGRIAGITEMTSSSSLGSDQHHACSSI